MFSINHNINIFYKLYFDMQTILNQEAFNLLNKYNIPTLNYKKAEHFSNLKNERYPIVLKIDSTKILHKTEQKAVRITRNLEEAKKNFSEMRKTGHVIYQPMFSGREFILGINKDPTFGQVIMFGLGGVFTEVLKDVSFRACPITKKDAKEMISEIKGQAILGKFRGEEPIDKDFLADLLVNLSNLAVKENVSEIDINPFTFQNKKGKAVDCRIIL